jgi:hypothetical protein
VVIPNASLWIGAGFRAGLRIGLPQALVSAGSIFVSMTDKEQSP